VCSLAESESGRLFLFFVFGTLVVVQFGAGFWLDGHILRVPTFSIMSCSARRFFAGGLALCGLPVWHASLPGSILSGVLPLLSFPVADLYELL